MTTTMKDIIPPVPLDVLKEELSKDRFIRKTNKAGNKIYIVNAANSPNTMREIGRLRELSFRNAGGGTGKSLCSGNPVADTIGISLNRTHCCG